MAARARSLPDGPPSLMTVDQIATLLQIHPAQVDRLVACGMPAIDISIPRPNRRRKRSLRFDAAAVMMWLQERRSA